MSIHRRLTKCKHCHAPAVIVEDGVVKERRWNVRGREAVETFVEHRCTGLAPAAVERYWVPRRG